MLEALQIQDQTLRQLKLAPYFALQQGYISSRNSPFDLEYYFFLALR